MVEGPSYQHQAHGYHENDCQAPCQSHSSHTSFVVSLTAPSNITYDCMCEACGNNRARNADGNVAIHPHAQRICHASYTTMRVANLQLQRPTLPNSPEPQPQTGQKSSVLHYAPVVICRWSFVTPRDSLISMTQPTARREGFVCTHRDGTNT